MASDYASIKAENIRRYGTDIARIGPMLLANRYDDRAHFIFELLQNAEDAIKRRSEEGPRSVHFSLSTNGLCFSHYGHLFTEQDVRGICGIGESTKADDLTAIGKFGIGFKAVYAFTNSPEIHSGDEHFAIDSFVWPRAVSPIELRPNETILNFTFRGDDGTAHDEIVAGLQRLGVRTLLFLRQVNEISWAVENGPSGTYLRGEPEPIAQNARQVTLVGQESSSLEIKEEAWLILSKEVARDNGDLAGYVEIAFALVDDVIQPITDSVLVVYFPTIVPTNVGFLIQGPYRTTPSRDNVPRNDRWNRYLIQETSTLLVNALHQLRDLDLLTVNVLNSLPIDSVRFGDGSMFQPLFNEVRAALTCDSLIPRFPGGHASAQTAKIARSQELRDLLNPSQLGKLFNVGSKLLWLSEDITQDRTPELRRYLIRDLEIAEVTPELMVTRLTKEFLEVQSDRWVCRLYEFLNGQSALLRLGRVDDVPVVRLDDGTHVTAQIDGQPQAFLPGPSDTGFPTVRRKVCVTAQARKFLESLGLTEPDVVHDVIWNVLPKYRGETIRIGRKAYEFDIRRILHAFGSDSTTQRGKLVEALRECKFVRAVKPADGSKCFTTAANVYLATERLKSLFEGVPGVHLVDDSYSCLRGEEVRELLEACGAVRYLRPFADSSLTWEERRSLRKQAGHAATSGHNDRITDRTLVGLEQLLNKLPDLDVEQRNKRARLLWEELANLEDRRGKGVFSGEYAWTHYGSYQTTFDAAFVRTLNATAWVPDGDGDLEVSEFVRFDALGWTPNPFLQSKIRFKPPIVEALAKEAGIEPGALDLLKKYGLTSEAELRRRLGLVESEASEDLTGPTSVSDAVREVLGENSVPTAPVPEASDAGTLGSSGANGGYGVDRPNGAMGRGAARRGSGGEEPGSMHGRKRTAGDERRAAGTDSRTFISYIATHPADEEPDPDGLEKGDRMALEARAIDLILSREPCWQRTRTHNPGYDLFETDQHGVTTRWCEVKAMAGSLHDRPVGLSHTQFECAREHVDAYWLYIVEHASRDTARIIRIQNPAGRARTFTFDHGWLSIADMDMLEEDRED